MPCPVKQFNIINGNSDLLILKYARYVFESILFRKDFMLTQAMPYCNQAPHTIFISNVERFTSKRCESIKFLESDAFI